MGILNIFKNKDNKADNQTKLMVNTEECSLTEMNNYMLASVRKENLSNMRSLSLKKAAAISPIANETIKAIKNVTGDVSSQKLYRITNLGVNDSLKTMADGKTFWGAIKSADGSKMAKLKEVNNIHAIDPTVMMMSVAIASIEAEITEIKEISKKIFSFLEYEKEAEIESDLEVLNRIITDFKYNLKDEKYIANTHKQIMDIKRTANKNMLFYKKGLKDSLLKEKVFTTNGAMNEILEDVQRKMGYYRLSLYIYSYATLTEVLVLGNTNSEYLLLKKSELDQLDNNYAEEFEKISSYIKKTANKSLTGNMLSSLGSAGKAIGNLAEKAKVKKVESWLNEKSENLKQTGKTIKENYVSEVEEMKVTNIKPFVDQIENLNCICNKTREIYFDDENIYLDIAEE